MNRTLLPLAAVLLSACTGSATGPEHLALEAYPPAFAAPAGAAHAQAELRNVSGQTVGTADFTEDATGRVHLTVHVQGISPGLHGLHLHAAGACDGSTPAPFSSAGGHFNPTSKEHGFHNPLGHHAGDLPNLVVNTAGVGHLSATADYLTLAMLFDADGTALVLHQNEDDLMTNSGAAGPGNSGARIACGVVQGR